MREDHTHLSAETDIVILEMQQNLKWKVIEESSPIDHIVEEAFLNINIKYNDLVINLPSIRPLRNCLQKPRRKTRLSVPQTIKELSSPLPDAYCKTTQGE